MTHADDPARALPPPSDAAWDFIARAASNPHFRRMIERLAREDTLMDADLTQPAPLTDERLAEMRERLARTPAMPFTVDNEPGIARVRMSEIRWAVYAMRDLLADNDRLRAELAAREEIVRAVAHPHKIERLYIATGVVSGYLTTIHTTGNASEQARALLAADGGA